MDTSTDAGAAGVEQDSKTRTPGGTVSSATKLKLAAFSASDIGVCCSHLSVLFLSCIAVRQVVFLFCCSLFVSLVVSKYVSKKRFQCPN